MRLLLASLAVLLSASSACSPEPLTTSSSRTDLTSRIEAIEAASGGRLGVAVFSRENGLSFSHRGAERFAMCSTFKLALAAMVLDTDGLRDQTLPFGPADILSYAPYAKERVAAGQMQALEAARHAVTISDNTAANLLLSRLGGPEGFTRWLREKGDSQTRLDRNEPTLNENAPGDPRDTTTPEASAELAYSLLWGEHLAAADRELLQYWMVETPTGQARLRDGLPDNLRAGDKTGTCGSDGQRAVSDIAFVETPDGTRFVLAAYLDRPAGETAQAEAALSHVAQAVADWISEKR